VLYRAIRDEDLGILPGVNFSLSTSPVPIRRSPFVGRKTELALLNGFLEKMLAGQGQLVLVTGNAGSGKTALIGEFVQRALQNQAGPIPVLGVAISIPGSAILTCRLSRSSDS
jgi:hypothetical protein